jgi:hypothetical protein
MTEAASFLVRRKDLRETSWATAQLAPGDGEALVRVESFAFTANNVTYAQLGEILHYWEFWPAPEGWGCVPVWGFAQVEDSRHPELPNGERLFGFWPMATHAILRPGRVGAEALLEGSAHRRKLPIAYNSYARVAAEPGHAGSNEDLEALFRPLFATSFLLDDFLAENRFFGAKRVVLLSASGKTALGLAHELKRRRGGEVAVVGLTSARNLAFAGGLGCYDEVLPYEAIGKLAVTPTVYVDFAGSSSVREAIHARLGEALKYACAVGISHGEARPKGEGLPGPKPKFFFAPEQGRKRSEEWGRDGYAQRLGEAWSAFLPLAQKAVRVVHGKGQAAVGQVYAQALAGRIPPERGSILSLHG